MMFDKLLCFVGLHAWRKAVAATMFTFEPVPGTDCKCCGEVFLGR